MKEKTQRGNRGYVTTPDLQAELCEQLTARGIAYQLVSEPLGLGEYPRPILVTNGAKPDKWTRYYRCKKCGNGAGLSAGGMVHDSCEVCTSDYLSKLHPEKLWQAIEDVTPWKTLGLPGWFDGTGAAFVSQVRIQLRDGELHGIGPEREAIVSQSLDSFRQRVLAALQENHQ